MGSTRYVYLLSILMVLANTVIANTLILFGEAGAKNGVSFANGVKYDGDCATLKNTLPGLPE